jgi:hypothetical protein
MLSFTRISIIAGAFILMLTAPSACISAKATKPTKSVAKPTAGTATIYKVRLKNPFGDAGTRTMTIDGKNFLWEVASPGMDLKLIKNNDGLFMLGSTPFIGKYPAGHKKENPMALFPGPIGDVKAFLKANNAKSLGKATLDEEKCDVHEYKDPVSGWKCKLWVNAAKNSPMKIEVEGPNKADRASATYLSYKVNQKIPSATFELPKGKQIRPVPEVTNQKSDTAKTKK